MAYKAKKTEHSGSKKGCGAYWGPKRDAKRESAHARRRAAQRQGMIERLKQRAAASSKKIEMPSSSPNS
jgi:hypothetical protein